MLGLARAAGKRSMRQVGTRQNTAHSLDSDSVVCQMRKVMQCSGARNYLGKQRFMGIKRPFFSGSRRNGARKKLSQELSRGARARKGRILTGLKSQII